MLVKVSIGSQLRPSSRANAGKRSTGERDGSARNLMTAPEPDDGNGRRARPPLITICDTVAQRLPLKLDLNRENDLDEVSGPGNQSEHVVGINTAIAELSASGSPARTMAPALRHQVVKEDWLPSCRVQRAGKRPSPTGSFEPPVFAANSTERPQSLPDFVLFRKRDGYAKLAAVTGTFCRVSVFAQCRFGGAS